jgi:regulator of cell morphogenesis and NO signaling
LHLLILIYLIMTTTSSTPELTIGEIVAADFRAAGIFRKAGIDFCCGGNKSLEKACGEKSIDQALVELQLEELKNLPADQTHNFKDWDLGFLSDYIINTHHKYVLKTLPELIFYTKKIASVHGSHHPELIEIADLFSIISAELLQHLQKEEEILFPAIKEVIKNNSKVAKFTIASEISRMSLEHEFAGGAMDKINVLALNYKVPDDGCNTYHVTFGLLRQFEDDLHNHVHLENNILYPKALML